MKATIWFTNMKQNMIHIIKYKVVQNLFTFFTVPIIFFTADVKKKSLVLHVSQYHFLGHTQHY